MKRVAIGAALLMLALVAVTGVSLFKHHHRSPTRTTTEVDNTASLTIALKQARAGATIALHPGKYSPLRLTNHTWPTAITLQANPAEKVTLPEITLVNVNGFRIDGLTITGQFQASGSGDIAVSNSTISQGVYLRDGTHNAQISNNQLHGGRFGVWIHNDSGKPRNHDITITGNDVSLQTSDNIQIGSCDNLLISKNVIHDIPDNPDHNDGVQLMGGRNVTISQNRFWNQDEAIILKAEPAALGTGTTVDDPIVENNLITHERGAGVIVAGADNVSVVNNTGADNRFADVHIESNNPGLHVWNNVVHQIYAMQPQQSGYESHNCVQDVQQDGVGDVHQAPDFKDHVWYELADDDACAHAAIATGAPSNDIAGQTRTGNIIAGAWQS